MTVAHWGGVNGETLALRVLRVGVGADPFSTRPPSDPVDAHAGSLCGR
jgi:hypothetical protein